MEPFGTTTECCETVSSRFHPGCFDLNSAHMCSLGSLRALSRTPSPRHDEKHDQPSRGNQSDVARWHRDRSGQSGFSRLGDSSLGEDSYGHGVVLECRRESEVTAGHCVRMVANHKSPNGYLRVGGDPLRMLDSATLQRGWLGALSSFRSRLLKPLDRTASREPRQRRRASRTSLLLGRLSCRAPS